MLIYGVIVALLLIIIIHIGRRIMAQLDDLKVAQDAVSAKVDEVAAEVAQLIAERVPPVDLTAAIAEEAATLAKLQAIPPIPVVST